MALSDIEIITIGSKEEKCFKSCRFTMRSRNYTIISTTHKGRQYIHTVKNDQGEYQDFEHSELIRMVEENP